MAQFLRQGSAYTFRAGPFVDSTDGDTAETALTIAQADIQISKAGGAFAQTSAAPTTTHDSDGWYQCPLTAADTGTLGTLTVKIRKAGALPVVHHFMVLPAALFDWLVAGTATLPVNVSQWLGTAAAAPDTAGHPKVTLKVGTGAGEVNLASGSVPIRTGLKKGAALANFPFMMVTTAGVPAVGLTVTVARSLNGGAFSAVGTATELSGGWYEIDLSASDMNGDTIALRMTASGAADQGVTLITEP